MASQVDAAEKLLEVDRQFRGVVEKKKRVAKQEPPLATVVLHMPTHVQMKRIDRATNTTSFVSGFYILSYGGGTLTFHECRLFQETSQELVDQDVLG